jgi:hypothetical protein
MQVNLHFVMLKDLSDAISAPSADDHASNVASAGVSNEVTNVARIEILRGWQPGKWDFDDFAFDPDPQT